MNAASLSSELCVSLIHCAITVLFVSSLFIRRDMQTLCKLDSHLIARPDFTCHTMFS